MKKFICLVLCLFLSVCCLSACSGYETNTPDATSDKINIVTTVFPIYDWIRNITGDISNVNINMLLDKGVDLHSFQPTADDIYNISECDVFVYVGGESDSWVGDVLKQVVNKNIIVVNLLDELGENAKEEEVKEGMQGEEEEEETDESPEYDEHIWLSVKNAQILTKVLCEKISQADPDNKNTYETNLASYTEKLSELDKKYEEAVNSATYKTLIFGDRFPFRYLFNDYGLDYYAAFVGCSAENEASFETIQFLTEKVNELNVKNIITIEGSDGKIAQSIIDNSESKNQNIVTLNSLQSITAVDVEKGISYLDIMEKNLNSLITAMN